MVVNIAGDILEGGGQILRIAVSMAAVLKKSVSISNIRAGRRQPGLAPQHLHGVLLVQGICGASVAGAAIKSVNLSFIPGDINCGEFSADTKTAGDTSDNGSIIKCRIKRIILFSDHKNFHLGIILSCKFRTDRAVLLAQVALPCCLYANGPTCLTLKGGTNADMAPQIEYSTRVLLPTLKKFGVSCDFEIKQRGFYPAGQGHVYFQTQAVKYMKAVQLQEFGDLLEIRGEAFHAGNIPRAVAEEMACAAENVLKSDVNVPVMIRVVHYSRKEAYGTGCGINLVATTTTGCLLGASQLGHPRTPPHQLGKAAASELMGYIRRGVCVDDHLQDQLIVYMALAAGVSSMRVGDVTLHTETAMHVAKLLCPAQFHIRHDGQTSIIECEGIGLANPHPL